jgi:hypothetical protein
MCVYIIQVNAALQEKLSQAKEDELQASLADTAKQLEEARAAAQEQARRLADEERQLARLQHEADMKVTSACTLPLSPGSTDFDLASLQQA